MQDINEIIESCWQRHFNHVTPGTPEYAVLVAAKEDLKTALAQAETD